MSEDEANRKSVRVSAIMLLAMANLLFVPFYVLLRRSVNHMSDADSIWAGWIFAAVVAVAGLISAYVQCRRNNQKLPRNVVLIAIMFMVLSGLITTIWISTHPTV